MSRVSRLIDGLHLLILAITGIVFAVADLLGLPRLMGDRLPMLTLLLVSLALASVSRLLRNDVSMHADIRRLLLEVELEKLDKVVEQIDPNLRKVFEDDYFMTVLNFFQLAVRDQCVHVDDWARFYHYYVRILRIFSKKTLFSVSTSITSDLWQNPMLVDAMAQFIKGRGKIRQIFFLKDIQELDLPTVQTVLASLKAIGVQVSIVLNGSTPHGLRKNFVVESKGKIGWEIHLDAEGNLTTAIVTTNQQTTASYLKTFGKLRGIEPRKLALPRG